LPITDSTQGINFAFTRRPHELVVATGSTFCRGYPDRWMTAHCDKVEQGASPMLSNDGEWIAVSNENQITVTQTLSGEQLTMKGEPLCFYEDRLRARVSGTGNSASILDYPLAKDAFPPDPLPTALPSLSKAICSFADVMYVERYDGWIARSIRESQNAQPIKLGSGETIALSSDSSYLAIPGNLRGSYLWQNILGKWQFVRHLPSANVLTLKHTGEAILGEEAGFVTISDLRDPRLLAHWTKGVPDKLSAQFVGRWQAIEKRDLAVEALSDTHPRHLSKDLTWEIEVTATEVEVRDGRNGNPILRFPSAGGTVNAAFSRDGKMVAFNNVDEFWAWSLDRERYVWLLCERLGEYSISNAPVQWDPAVFKHVCGPRNSQSWIVHNGTRRP